MFSRTLNVAFAFVRITKDLFVIGIPMFCSNCKFALGGRKETQSQQGITICLHSLHFPGSTETEKSRPLFFVLMFAVVFVSTYFSWSSESKHFTEHKQYSLETKLFNERSNWLMSVTKWNQREMVTFMGYLA